MSYAVAPVKPVTTIVVVAVVTVPAVKVPEPVVKPKGKKNCLNFFPHQKYVVYVHCRYSTRNKHLFLKIFQSLVVFDTGIVILL